MKIGVNPCPQLRLNVKVKEQQCISRIFSLLGQPLSLTSMSLWGFGRRRKPRLVSCALINPQRRRTGTTLYSVIVWFSISQEFLSASTSCTVTRIAPEFEPTGPSDMEWDNLWEAGLILWNSIRSLKKNGRRIWKLSGSIPRFYIALPRNPDRAMRSWR